MLTDRKHQNYLNLGIYKTKDNLYKNLKCFIDLKVMI